MKFRLKNPKKLGPSWNFLCDSTATVQSMIWEICYEGRKFQSRHILFFLLPRSGSDVEVLYVMQHILFVFFASGGACTTRLVYRSQRYAKMGLVRETEEAVGVC